MASRSQNDSSAGSFKERHVDLQHLVRELMAIFRGNQRLGGRALQQGFPFAQGALTVVALERFLRAILPGATDDDRFRSLLARAFDSGLLEPPFKDRATGVQQICDFRNALVHGNFDQAARGAGSATVREYLDTQYVLEAQRALELVDQLMGQIDPETGRRKGKT